MEWSSKVGKRLTGNSRSQKVKLYISFFKGFIVCGLSYAERLTMCIGFVGVKIWEIFFNQLVK